VNAIRLAHSVHSQQLHFCSTSSHRLCDDREEGIHEKRHRHLYMHTIMDTFFSSRTRSRSPRRSHTRSPVRGSGGDRAASADKNGAAGGSRSRSR